MKSSVIVVGAGPVGAAFALLAHEAGVQVRLIDAREGPSRETRTLALSHGSQVLLARAGLSARFWQSDAVAEIHQVHTSQAGGFGRVKLMREDAGVPALGYVVRYAALQDALDAALAARRIAVTYGAKVTTIDAASGHLAWTLAGKADTASEASADVVALADGGANLAKLPSISVDEKDYGQSAMLGHVVLDRVHHNIAYERFTASGPLALLPSPGVPNEMSMVWVDSHAHTDQRMALTEEACRDAFQAAFGTRAGKLVSLSARRSYPLRLRQASSRTAGRVAIIGNAAQAMHPVAGQGFNLGLRDASTLAGLTATLAPNLVPLAYGAARRDDVSRGVAFTDLLASGFMGDTTPLRVVRGSILAAVDMVPLARRMLARRMLFGAGNR